MNRKGKGKRNKERERKKDRRQRDGKKENKKQRKKERTIKYIYTQFTFPSSLTGNLENFWGNPSLIRGNT